MKLFIICPLEKYKRLWNIHPLWCSVCQPDRCPHDPLRRVDLESAHCTNNLRSLYKCKCLYGVLSQHGLMVWQMALRVNRCQLVLFTCRCVRAAGQMPFYLLQAAVSFFNTLCSCWTSVLHAGCHDKVVRTGWHALAVPGVLILALFAFGVGLGLEFCVLWVAWICARWNLVFSDLKF